VVISKPIKLRAGIGAIQMNGQLIYNAAWQAAEK
jgi:hypothetical protein